MGEKKERGAIVVEATLSLTAFVFVMFTFLSIVNVVYIQAKMSVALNSAAKEIAQYSYLYYKFGLDEAEGKLADEAADAKNTAQETIDGVSELVSGLTEGKEALAEGDFETMFKEIEDGKATVESLYTLYGDKLSNDPKGFIIGMGKLALSEGITYGKGILAELLAKAFMQKNLKAHVDDDPDAFLKRYHIENGMDDLSFKYSSLMANGKTNEIQLVVTYDVKVIQLLDIDFTFTFRQCAKTKAWGNGVSVIKGDDGGESEAEKTSSIWDEPNTTLRGDTIILEEKKSFTYTSTKNGFHAYNNSGSKNEFVKITTIDTTLPSYETVSQLKSRIKQMYTSMEKQVSKLPSEITVDNKSGGTVTLTSDPDTRTYKVIVVIPDSADRTKINEAIRQLEAENLGLDVEIKTGYGDPTPKTDNEETEESTEEAATKNAA